MTSNPRSTAKRKGQTESFSLPDELFRAFGMLLPDFMRLTEACDLNSVEIFTLIYLRNHGKIMDNGRRGILRHDFTGLLEREVRYSDGDVDLHLGRMEQKELVSRQRITHDQKQKFFGTGSGRLAVVVLLPKGLEKIEELKRRLNELFAAKLTRIPNSLLPLFLKAMPLLTSAARSIVDLTQAPSVKK